MACTPNNDGTFNNFTAEQWNDLVKQFDQVLAGWEQADDATLAKNVNMIATSGPTTPTTSARSSSSAKNKAPWDPAKGQK